MTSRFAYANPMSLSDYQDAITEAWAQAESLYEHSERLHAEANRWEDRARTLEMEMQELL